MAKIFRSPHSGLLNYTDRDGNTSILPVIQDNIFKLNEEVTEYPRDYKLLPIQTDDGTFTYRLVSAPQIVSIGGGGGSKRAINISDEGTNLGVANTLNFVGLGVTVTLNASTGAAEIMIGDGGGMIGGGGTLNFIPKFTPDGTHIGDSQLFDNGTSIGFDTVTPVSVATFDIVSTTQGILFPRMTTAQRDAIAVGATSDSLFIYNITTNKFNYWDNDAAVWQSIDTHMGTGDVEGSGTTNFITKWTDGANSIIGNSQVFDDGTNVGVGISAGLLSKLHVAGAIRTGVASTTNGSLVFQNSTNANTITVNSGVTSASYSVTLPTAQAATANSFLMNDGAGVLTWNNGLGLFFAQGGNSFGAPAILGTNDAFSLSFETSGVTRETISATGLFGINTAPVAGTLVTVQSTGTTSATFIEQWFNSTPTLLFAVRDDGYISAGRSNGSMTIGLGSAFSSAVSSNTFIGVSVGGAASGGGNTGVGNEALFSLTTGTGNVAMGVSALRSNSTGTDNTAVGNGTLTNNNGTSNSAFGMNALTANTTGVNNTAIGAGALDSNTIGTNNTAVGVSPLQSNTTGEQNVAIGSSALNSNIIGNRNIGIGFEAGYFETGSDKLFIDNRQRTNEADGRAKALVYGKMAATTADQVFNVNANLGIGIGDGAFGTSADFVLGFKNGTSPTTSPADITQLWSVDIEGVAGAAGLHIRTEGNWINAIGQYYHSGDPAVNGSWRWGISGDDFIFQQREAGVWNTKFTILGA